MEIPCDEKPDDLEITSIGSLHRGHWEKKYWSCSRGKDRYPYPVGYEAVRTHAGSTYRMEIHEGLKGPLFVVTSTDGDSCTGQTPDMAWENFQKKSGPRVKNCHGKRFSSKIDGVELFGFRNPFVQRLLRELVANVSGVAERNLVSHNFCNKVSNGNHETKNEGSHADPNLLPYLGKQQNTRKRSIKGRIATESPIKDATVKKTRCQVLLNDVDSNTSELAGGLCSFADDSAVRFHVEHMPSSKDGAALQLNQSPMDGVDATNIQKLDPCCQIDVKSFGCATSIENFNGNIDPGSSFQVKAYAAAEENCQHFLAGDENQMDAENSDDFADKHVIFHEQSKLIGHGNSQFMRADKISLDKPLDAEVQGDSLVAAKDIDGQFVDLTSYSDVCVPDTCDTAKYSLAGSLLESHRGNPYNMKDEIVVARTMSIASPSYAPDVTSISGPRELTCRSKHDALKSMHPLLKVVSCTPEALSKCLVKDSFPEVGSSSSSSNPSSDKMDLDLAGQELTRSMMTFLLPRAVPLLKKTYAKKRSRRRSLQNDKDPCSTASIPKSAEQTESVHLTKIICQGKPVAETLVQGQKEDVQEEINVPETLLKGGSRCLIIKTKLPVTTCMNTEPLMGSESLEDAKSIIPDSFEDDNYVYDVAVKKHPGISQLDITPFDGKRGSVGSSMFHVNNARGGEFFSKSLSGNDEFNGVLLPDGYENNEVFFSNSVLPCFQPDDSIAMKTVLHEESMFENEKISHEEPSYLHNKTIGCSPFQSDELLKQDPPHPCHNSDNLGDAMVSNTNMIRSQNWFSRPHELVNIDVHLSRSSGVDNVRSQKDSACISQGELGGKAVASMESNSSIGSMSDKSAIGGHQTYSQTVGIFPHTSNSSRKYDVPLSESIICRNFDGSKLASFDENDQDRPNSCAVNMNISVPDNVEQQPCNLNTVKNAPPSEQALLTSAPVSENKDVVKIVDGDAKPSDKIDPSESSLVKNCANAVRELCAPVKNCIPQFHEWTNSLSDQIGDHVLEALPCSENNILTHSNDFSSKEANSNKVTGNPTEFVGCYLHPKPVLSVLLGTNGDDLQISVLCGLLEDNIRNVFVFLVPVQGQRGSCPSFVGYTSLLFPHFKGLQNEKMRSERSGFQFTPDGQSLVFLNTIKAPHCREQNIDCLCSNCKSDCEENTIEIVELKCGYVSSVAKLLTVESVSSILVFEPNYLIAAKESGKLHVWIMNIQWSENLEEFMLPCFDYISPMPLELKRIPNSNSIIGHNGFGSFGLWDISKRVLLARFSLPGATTFQILPIGLVNWQNQDLLATGSGTGTEERMKETICAVDNWVSGENTLTSSSDVAVWLLISATSGSEVQHEAELNKCPIGWWRLALLAKNAVVMGDILDPRASAVNASANYGIYGTCDGFLYKWELSTGEKLANLHPFKSGEGVSGVAVDPKSGAFAVAGDRCELLVYRQPQG